MATNQLAIYNIALASVGERVLDDIKENRTARKTLDEIWDRGNGAINHALEQGLWNFAMKETSSTHSTTGNFNFQYIHNLPSDFVRLSAISADQNFGTPLGRYEFQSTMIRTDEQTIYIRYVSNSSTLGNNLSLWPDTFTLYVGYWMATQIAPGVENMTERKMVMLERKARHLLFNAQSKDASQEPTRFPPLSSWASARIGSRGRRDRGSRTTLTG